MSRRNDRFINDDSPARRREERARQTKLDVQDEIRRLSRLEYEERQQRDWEAVSGYLESKVEGSRKEKRDPDDYSAYLAPGGVAPDSRLEQSRKKNPGVGRQPWV